MQLIFCLLQCLQRFTVRVFCSDLKVHDLQILRRRPILGEKIFRQSLPCGELASFFNQRLHGLRVPFLLRCHQSLQKLVILRVGICLRQLLDSLFICLNQSRVPEFPSSK